jgi:hypothetical protein
LGAYGALKIVKNGLELRKFTAPQTRGSQELNKNKPPNTTKAIPNHPKSWVYMDT